MPNSTCYKVVTAGSPNSSKEWVKNQGLTVKHYTLNGHTEGPRLFVYADLRDAQRELIDLVNGWGLRGHLILRCECGPLTRLPTGEVWKDHKGQKKMLTSGRFASGDVDVRPPPDVFQWLLEGSDIPAGAYITDWVVPVEEIHHAKH